MRHSGVKSPLSVENAEIQSKIKASVLYLGSPPKQSGQCIRESEVPHVLEGWRRAREESTNMTRVNTASHEQS